MGRPTLAISGQGAPASETVLALARECGRIAASRGAIVLTGGLGGVMAAAAEGARAGGGRVVAVLPGTDPGDAGADADVVVCSGVGEARDLTLVASAGAVVAIGGGWGTLAEIGLARKLGRAVVLLRTWDVTPPDGWDAGPELLRASTPAQAIELALGAAR